MFCLDNTASQTANLTRVNRNTVNNWYNTFRKIIYLNRVRKKSYSQIINANRLIISIHQEGDNVFTDFTPIEEHQQLIDYFKNKNKNKKYDFLVYLEKSKYISFSSNTRELKLFWIFCESRLSKFNGVSKYFDLHLKECE